VNLGQTVAYFESLGVFWPKFNTILSGSAELVCGALLVIGLASRVAAVPLVINMLVAYIASSGDAVRHLFTNANEFITAPEFTYLAACLLVLMFGPGMISMDGLFGIFLGGIPAEEPSARTAPGKALGRARSSASNDGGQVVEPATHQRREFAKLSAAAFVGLLAGILVNRARQPAPNGEKPAVAVGPPPSTAPPSTTRSPSTRSPSAPSTPAAPPEPSAAKAGSATSNSSTAESDLAEKNPPPPGTDINLLLTSASHVCRGLNTCKGKDKNHNNSCAGRGSCAIAESHVCNGLNDCKGQGGCAKTAGINECKGKGACAVPLKEATWKLARARFEQLAKSKGVAVGPAPAKG
jgi:uncharacterized membrane protein YphA (DoxX/SURF4 family)